MSFLCESIYKGVQLFHPGFHLVVNHISLADTLYKLVLKATSFLSAFTTFGTDQTVQPAHPKLQGSCLFLWLSRFSHDMAHLSTYNII